jgi:hypothetical protein
MLLSTNGLEKATGRRAESLVLSLSASSTPHGIPHQLASRLPYLACLFHLYVRNDMGSNYKPQGYHRLAQVMGRSGELAIFRKFNDLNMLSLMSLQAELVELRDDFYEIAADDEKSGHAFDRNFAMLFESKQQANNFQHKKLETIREKTKEYSEISPLPTR